METHMIRLELSSGTIPPRPSMRLRAGRSLTRFRRTSNVREGCRLPERVRSRRPWSGLVSALKNANCHVLSFACVRSSALQDIYEGKIRQVITTAHSNACGPWHCAMRLVRTFQAFMHNLLVHEPAQPDWANQWVPQKWVEPAGKAATTPSDLESCVTSPSKPRFVVF
jgi:hypothetical protein